MSSTFFTTGDGDVILRAGQEPGPKHDFRVHKLILCLASSVFKDMFAFPQPSDQNPVAQSDIPIIDVPDSPQTLDTILRFIYPGVEPPKFTDLSALSDLLAATDKYNIASMRPVLREALSSFIETQPCRVYIIACQLGLLEEAKAAARMTTPDLIVLPAEHERDVRHVSGVDLYRLVWFCHTRETAVGERVQDLSGMEPDDYFNPCITGHWDECRDYYAKLKQALRAELKVNPHAGVSDLDAVLASLPDPPPGCPDEDSMAGIDINCPFRISFIRDRLGILARRLKGVNDRLLKEAFEKEF